MVDLFKRSNSRNTVVLPIHHPPVYIYIYMYSYQHPTSFTLFSALTLPAMKKKENLSTFLSLLILSFSIKTSAAAALTLQIEKGFKANCDPSSNHFQPLLADPTGVFSLGFFQLNSSQLDLAVVHVPSGDPVWRAALAFPARWSSSAFLSFDGNLVFSDPVTGLVWSTHTAAAGDRVVLLNSSNLQILKLAEPTAASVLWQSFDFPSDTIVQGQNFTSTAALFSVNQRYSMRLGSNYIALFMEFGRGAEKPMYWKRTALEEKNQIVDDEGPIYAQVDPIGFLGLYQKDKKPVDVLPFDSFNRGIHGLRRLTMEADGNLKGYYWNGTLWIDDYAAITELCELPSACGAYGLCRASAPRCGCIDNSTEGCLPAESGDLCGRGDEFRVLRMKGVDLANKELLGFVKVRALEECEGLCEKNCSCWGAIYNNGTGYCYRMDYPVETAVWVGDERKMGYFKVRDRESGGGGEGEKGRSMKAEVAVVVVAAIAVAGGGVGIYRLWSVRRRRRGEGGDGSMVEGLAPGPYKDLNSSSFRSIELAESFRK